MLDGSKCSYYPYATRETIKHGHGGHTFVLGEVFVVILEFFPDLLVINTEAQK